MSIAQILARQREEISEKLGGKIVERDLQKPLGRMIPKPITKVITGVRRSGKSTLAILALRGRKFGYVNFDELELLKATLDQILSGMREVYGNVRTLLLDEIQNIDGWELWVNSLQRRGYNLVITGSNAKMLSKELATHLTGRYLEFENFPFSFREFLVFKGFDASGIEHLSEKQGKAKRLLREYLQKGGFPEYLVKELDDDYFVTLFNSIIYADIVRRWGIKYPPKMEELLRYSMEIFAREFTFSKLKRILGFSSKLTVQNYMRYAEETYLITSLNRFSFKPKEVIRSPKKVYVIDSGLANALSSRTTPDIGRLMENAVFIELRRRGLRQNRSIFYFKTQEGHEVDFVIKDGTRIKQLLQVSYISSPDEVDRRELRALNKASEVLKCKNLLVLTWDMESSEDFRGKKIKFMPLWKWLAHQSI